MGMSELQILALHREQVSPYSVEMIDGVVGHATHRSYNGFFI
jgi:hypothetical protein